MLMIYGTIIGATIYERKDKILHNGNGGCISSHCFRFVNYFYELGDSNELCRWRYGKLPWTKMGY